MQTPPSAPQEPDMGPELLLLVLALRRFLDALDQRIPPTTEVPKRTIGF